MWSLSESTVHSWPSSTPPAATPITALSTDCWTCLPNNGSLTSSTWSTYLKYQISSGEWPSNMWSRQSTRQQASTIASYPPNRVLQRKPPDINKEENLLPRPARSELARLRSDFSRNLNSYMSRIDPSIQDTCPSCNHTPHDTNHLFNCGSRPTDLEPSALCTHPK